MKHLKFLFLFISLAIFASCSESDVEGGVIGDANQAIFSGTIGELQTRVTDNSWDSGDAIGVYALMADQALSDAAIFDGKSNVKYTTTGNGTFTAAGTPINFSETGNLDFVSYYPFKTAITDYKYSIDVTSQSDMAAIDLLYSNNAKGANKSAPNVALKFNHMLSKFEMNVQLGEDLISLEGLTVNIKSVIVDGSLALVDGAITTGTTRKDITPKVSIASGNKTATVAAIVVPGQNLKDVTIVFSLGGKDYKWTPTSQELLSTYRYAYTVKLTLDESGEPVVVPVIIGATINDWNDPQIGDTPIVLEPETEGVDPFINVAPTSLNFAKEAGSETIAVTANVSWTASSNAAWATISPASGTNNGTITVNVQANTGAEARNAAITITDGTLTKTVAVTQAGAGTTPPAGALLFPGSDFNNWTTFLSVLSSHGLKDYATESASGGREGSGAMHIKGTPGGNDYVFTALVPEGFSASGKSKINFWIKGTAAKSLSMNVYIGPGTKMGTDYKTYNMDEYAIYNSHKVIEPTDSNSYTKGTIDTSGEWIQVTLDISSIAGQINTTAGQNLFALKVGKDVAYDLFVDYITIE